MISIDRIRLPVSTKSNIPLVIILFIISVCYLVPLLTMRVSAYDEGIVLTGADRILKGDVPYKDFWTIYTPGQYYILAFLFKLFGSSIFIERVYDILVKANICILSFVIIRQFDFSRKLAIVSWATSLFWISYSGFAVYPVYPALLAIYLSICSFLYYLKHNSMSALVTCAVFITISALFRHDFGAMAFLAVTIVILVKMFLSKERGRYELLYFTGAVFLTSLPFLVIALINIDLRILINQMIVLPAEIMPKYRSLPYPDLSLRNIEFYAFPLVLLTGSMTAVYLVVKSKQHHQLSLGLLLVSIIGLFLLNQVRVRSDIAHLIPAAIVSFLVFPVIWKGINEIFSPNSSKIIYGFLTIIICIAFLIAIIVNNNSSGRYSNKIAIEIARAGYASIPLDLQYVVAYIKKSTSKDESIYVGVTDHDQFIANDTIIYYLAERGYATRFNQFDPGVSNTLKSQKIIVEELKKINLLVLSKNYRYEPNDTRFNLNINLIDNYIERYYKVERVIGRYLILRKKKFN